MNRRQFLTGLGAVLSVILMLLAAGCSDRPGFYIQHKTWRYVTGFGSSAGPGTPRSTFWQVTNTWDGPLVISRVVYNGEWEAKLTNNSGGILREGGLPITLTVGESCYFFEYCSTEDPIFKARNLRFLDALRDLGEKPEGTTNREQLMKAQKEGRMNRVYRKEVIYIDIETSRGTFRYQPTEWRFERLD